jgi:hypothetical protein
VTYHDLGWDPNRASRPTLFQKLDDAMFRRTIETYDQVTLDEYRHFCYNSEGKPEAEPGYHDDCVIADALCVIAMPFALKMEPLRKRPGGRAPLPTKYGQSAEYYAKERGKQMWEARERNSIEGLRRQWENRNK